MAPCAEAGPPHPGPGPGAPPVNAEQGRGGRAREGPHSLTPGSAAQARPFPPQPAGRASSHFHLFPGGQPSSRVRAPAPGGRELETQAPSPAGSVPATGQTLVARKSEDVGHRPVRHESAPARFPAPAARRRPLAASSPDGTACFPSLSSWSLPPELFTSPPTHGLQAHLSALRTQSSRTHRGHGGRELCLHPASPPAPFSSTAVSPLLISGRREGGLPLSSGAGGGCWPAEVLGHFAVTGRSRRPVQGPRWDACEACAMPSPEWMESGRKVSRTPTLTGVGSSQFGRKGFPGVQTCIWGFPLISELRGHSTGTRALEGEFWAQ